MTVPDFMPVLSAGAHKDPRDGACVMEYLSLLAGEPWSDHPACTHPVLARMARNVNDMLDDSERHRLVPLVGRLLGTAPIGSALEQRQLSVRLAVWCARQVLPLTRDQDRAICEAAIGAAETWADKPTQDKAAADADAAWAAAVTAAAAATAVTAAAATAARRGGVDLVGLLTGLLDEHDRLTGHTPVTVTPDELRVLAQAAGVPA